MYIGVTIDPERRWAQHRSMNTNCSVLKSAVKKYGVEKFTFTLLVCGEDNHIDEMEVKAIEIFNTQAPNGYNITLGGDGTNLFKWEDEWNKLLGTAPDIVIAKKTGTSIGVVSARRKGAGIQSYAEKNRFDWKDYDHLLGTKSDIALSKELNFSATSISNRRILLKIPKYKTPEYTLPKDLIELLGYESDLSLSRKFDITVSYISKKRKALGIPPVKQDSWVVCRDWSEEELSHVTNTELTTKDLVKILNLSRTTIQNKRKELGVKYNRFGKRGKYEMTSNLIEELLDDTFTDEYFKDKYGMSSSTVSAKRKQIINSLKEGTNDKTER
jgi:hypothetical protein